jgi:hypothetical protein
MTMYEPLLMVAQRLLTPLQLPLVNEESFIIRMTMHEPFLIVAQRLPTPLQLPPVEERKIV